MNADAIERLLLAEIGLDASSIGRRAVETATRARMAACGIASADEYGRHAGASKTELRELVETIVVPETSFFREPGSFAALAELAVREARPLRVLSTPCSTGEEPYSVAIALLDAGIAEDRFVVDAVDVSSRALALARRGVYGRNSFRVREPGSFGSHFEKHEEGYRVAERVRRRVRLSEANMVSPDFLAGSEPYDFILCRNLLIYFPRDVQTRVLAMLGRLLAPGGVLFVGPSEAYTAAESGYTSIGIPMSFGYRLGRPSTDRVVAPRPKPAVARPLRTAPRAAVSQLSSPRVAPPVVSERAPQVAERLDAAARLADAGELEAAATLCTEALRFETSASGYYLLGVIYDAMSDDARAADAYRRALYLEPDHVDALAHLALLAARRGDASATRLRQRAERASRLAAERDGGLEARR